ncbi:hypothetical protein BEH94_07650 [Candidatus Altiarchaeales archaeon WOR_SM1_SCG]|nr:hypothetical protein BEH94_07650 [Candidatus Altiarchaeales archaeon WOR_SM1_SCG]
MFSPVIIEYEVKEEEWEKDFSVNTLKPKSKIEPVISGIDELKSELDKIENYTFVFIYDGVTEDDLKNNFEFESYSNLEGIFIGRIKNIFIFFGENRDKDLMESLNTCIIRSIGIQLNLKSKKLESLVNSYREIIDEIDREIKDAEKGKKPEIEVLKKLIDKNKIVMPFITENEKRTEKLKQISGKDNLRGVFNSILMKINEEEIATLKTWADVSLEYENLLVQHQSQQEMINLEKAIHYLYLFVGTFYVTELILLLFESYPPHYPILFTLPLFWFNVSVIVFSFLFSYFVLNYLSKTINWIKNKK